MKNLFVVAAAFFSIVAGVIGGDAVEIGSEQTRISFDARKGALVNFFSMSSRHDFVSTPTNGYLWELRWRDVASGNDGTINSAAAQSFRFEQKTATNAVLVWTNLGLTSAPQLQVEAAVSLDKSSSLSYWQLVLRNAGAIRFDEVRFPCVQNIAAQTNECFAAPVWMGQLANDPRTMLNKGGQAREWRYDYPGLTSMQCFALYRNRGPGLYFSCDDTNAFHKTFVFSGNGKGALDFKLLQLPENDSKDTHDYTQPYRVVLGSFSGDWFTAAEMYRAWGTNQWWAREARLKQAHSWAPETALWIWNRGRSEKVIGPAIALQKELRLPVSVMWHWWHGCAYDIGFPEYLPPREGSVSFSNAVAKAHMKDIRAIVYMNQRLWGMTTKSWDDLGASNFAVLGSNGKINPEVYNTFTKSPCASMCMGTEFWRNHYATLTKGAFDLGVDGIYMDQACSSLACYNPAHGHPVGGGTYWMSGFKKMVADIRSRVPRDKTIALAGEGVGESWLPYLDLMLSLQVSKERYAGPDGWEPIPFFQAVYHPYVIQYGNYSSLTMPPYDELWPPQFAPKEPLKLLDRKFSQQFYLEQARAFVWGQQPTIANFRESQLKERAEEIGYVVQLAKLRQKSLEYLQNGTFLGVPQLKVGRKTIDMSRLSIYAGQTGGLTSFTNEVQLALAGAWKAGDGRSVAVAVASISEDPQSVLVSLARLKRDLPKKGWIYRVEAGRKTKLGPIDPNRSAIAVNLSARGVCLLEFVP